MHGACLEKFRQNLDLKTKLLKTNDAILIEASHKDSYWGYGPNKKGKNKLGKILMKVRQFLENEEKYQFTS